MANPNIAAVTDIKGKMAYADLTTSSAEIVANGGGSNQIYKISSVAVSNKGSVSSGVTLQARRGGTDYSLATGITIPERTTVVLLDKNNPIYLEEGDSLRSQASTANTLVLAVTYETLS